MKKKLKDLKIGDKIIMKDDLGEDVVIIVTGVDIEAHGAYVNYEVLTRDYFTGDQDEEFEVS
jgi:hypothetical protein